MRPVGGSHEAGVLPCSLLGAVQSPYGSLIGGVKPSAAGHQRPLTAKTPHRIAVARPSKGERRHATGAAGLTDSGRIRHPCHQGGLGGIPRHFRSIIGVAAADHLLPGRRVGGKLHPVVAFVTNGRASVDLRGACRWCCRDGHRRRDGRGWCRKGSTYSSSALADGGADHRTLPAGSCPVELSSGWLWRRQVEMTEPGAAQSRLRRGSRGLVLDRLTV